VDQFEVHPFLTPRIHPPSRPSPPPVPLSTPIPPPPTPTWYGWLLDHFIYKFAYLWWFNRNINIPLNNLIHVTQCQQPIANHSNVLGSLSHIIYKYSGGSDPYCIIVFYFCFNVPFCIPFLVCYFCFFSLDSSHSHDSSPFFLFCSYCSHLFLMLINPPMTPIDFLLFLL